MRHIANVNRRLSNSLVLLRFHPLARVHLVFEICCCCLNFGLYILLDFMAGKILLRADMDEEIRSSEKHQAVLGVNNVG